MGFRVSWLAVRDSSIEHVLHVLGARTGDEFETEESDYFELDMSGSSGRKGWYIVTFGSYDHPSFSETTFAHLSQSTELFACAVHETVMDSGCEKWVRGKRDWYVRHQSEQAIDHLACEGHYPVQRTICLRQRAIRLSVQDGEVDYMFEVPSLLAWRETGFKHDRRTRQPQRFVELISSGQRNAAPATKPKWKFW